MLESKVMQGNLGQSVVKLLKNAPRSQNLVRRISVCGVQRSSSSDLESTRGQTAKKNTVVIKFGQKNFLLEPESSVFPGSKVRVQRLS